MEQQLKIPQKLLNRDFLLLWQGQAVSQFGKQAFTIALVFWIKHATDSATLMGFILMISSLPAVFLGPIGGTVADEYSRRNIILIADVLSGIAVLSVAALMFFTESVPIITAMFVLVSLLLAIISAFFLPAINAAIPALVPENRLAGANSLTQLSYQLAQFFGQAIGGTLFRLLGAPILFLIDGVTYLFSALSESFITIPQTIPERSPNWQTALERFKRDTITGLQYVWHQPGLRELVLVSAILNFFLTPILLLLPFYIEDHLQLEPDWYGYFLATYGLGSMLGAILAGAVPYKAKTRARLMSIFFLAEPLGYIILGLVTNRYLSLVAALSGGLLSGFVLVNITTILQMSTPENIRGRVFGLLATIAAALTPVGMGLSGVIADLTGQDIPLLYIGSGVIAIILSLLIIVRPDLQQYLAYEAVPHPSEQPTAMDKSQHLAGKEVCSDTYLGYAAESDQNVAITFIGNGRAGDDASLTTYANRALALSQIRHPNIATIYYTGETAAGQPYFVSEQIDGRLLSDQIEQMTEQPPAERTIYALNVVKQIASGLSLAECLGCYHYELTPKHILLRRDMLNSDDSAVLMGLDVPTAMRSNSNAGHVPELSGYLSPEQLDGKEIDGRSHVYSLGMILCQLLTGELPENRSFWRQTLSRKGGFETALDKLRTNLSSETYDLVEKSVRRRPKSRHSTIAEFGEHLDQALAAESRLVHGGDSAKPRRSKTVYFIPIVLLLLLALGIWQFVPGNSGSRILFAGDGGSSSGMIAGALEASLTPTATANDASALSAVTAATMNPPTPTPSATSVTKISAELKSEPTIIPTVTSTPTMPIERVEVPTEIPATATEFLPTPLASYAVSVSSASLRQGPGTNYPVDSYLYYDETVTIIGKTTDSPIWYLVATDDNRTGWISAAVGRSIGPTDVENVPEAATIPPPPPTDTPTPTPTPTYTPTPFTATLPSSDETADPNDQPTVLGAL